MTQFYVDAQGVYFGGFDGAAPPVGAIEVPNPPAHGDDIWLNGAWDAAPPVVPQIVTRRQALQALILRGVDDDVDAALSTISDPIQRKLARVEFDASTVFERHRPLVVSIGAALSLDLDELFTFAATL